MRADVSKIISAKCPECGINAFDNPNNTLLDPSCIHVVSNQYQVIYYPTTIIYKYDVSLMPHTLVYMADEVIRKTILILKGQCVRLTKERIDKLLILK